MEQQFISSLQNQKVKQLVLLQQKSSERRRTGLFVVEGVREMGHCMRAGCEIDSIYYCASLFSDFCAVFIPPEGYHKICR